MDVNLKTEFTIIADGASYMLPCYEVQDNVGIVPVQDQHVTISFVRGSKLGTEDVERHTGTLHEHLLSAMIHDLKMKNNIVPSRESALVITSLEQALHWLWARQIDRAQRNVLGTYQK